MRSCVVGNGPSAEGKGAEIDACDFVVRIKAWWAHGAENAGERIDAWAWYGDEIQLAGPIPEMNSERWFTQTVSQVRANPAAWDRVASLVRTASLQPIRWVPDLLWDAAFRRLEWHPSTGFVAVCMAIAIKRPDELVLYGFDSTAPDRANYQDARSEPLPPRLLSHPPHDVLAEKRAMADLFNGKWLGEPCRTALEWPQMPDLGGDCG